MVKKALLRDKKRNQIEPQNGISSVLCQNEKIMQVFASCSSEQEHFTHGMYMLALIRLSDVKKSNRSCSM